MKPIKLYWSSTLKNGRKNVGDWLSPALVELLSGRPVIHARPNDCDLVAIGSLLQRVKHHFWNRRIHIWGTGFIAAQGPVPERHYYHAVRGLETAALIKNNSIKTFGDPGLLVDRLLPNYKSITKKYHIGVIPHFMDQNHLQVRAFIESTRNAVFLDILAEPMDFLRQIAECEFILSSSLHGLIMADAFHIPNAWIELSQQVVGKQFKFRDYYSVFGIQAQASQLDLLTVQEIEKIAEQYARPGLSLIQKNLIDSFPILY